MRFFNWIVFLLAVEPDEFFIYFGDETHVQCIIGKHVCPYGQFPFHFNNGFFSHAEAFQVDVVPFVYFFSFISLALADISAKILRHGISEILLPVFSARTFRVPPLT